MDDVTRALEKADAAVATSNPATTMALQSVGRAYFLACVQSLPPDMTVAELAAAIEKERT